jgi:uncharacterized membrane protein YphA (DoxX/SURF4 family)
MIRNYLQSLSEQILSVWNRFWFQPADCAPLSVIRIATGLLLFYSHIVWAMNSESFFGPESWLSADAASAIQSGSSSYSFLWLVDSLPGVISVVHVGALLIALLLIIGYYSRAAAIAAFVMTISFANRNPTALYGFDQVLGFLTLYLSINPGEGRLSLTSWLRRRKHICSVTVSTSANVALRLMQSHLCLLYLVSGLSKLKGLTWWSGVAFWGAVGNLEYQTVDLTWMVDWPIAINLLTYTVLVWEISYCFLVWNRWLRPIVIVMAIPVHLGIAVCFGMITFGLAMLVANLAFVGPALIEEALSCIGSGRASRGGIQPITRAGARRGYI